MRVQFSKGASIKGEYTFRKEPKDNFLSTLESIAYCLTVLEPPPRPSRPREGAVPTGWQDEKTVSEWLMQAFKAMVNNQVQFLPRAGWSGAHAESEKGLRTQGSVDAYTQADPRDLQIDATPRD